MTPNKKLPLFLHDKKTAEIFKTVVTSIPAGTKVYLVGGAMRNAIYYKYFRKAILRGRFFLDMCC